MSSSSDFCDNDADITFKSSDNIVFNIHSKYLVGAGGFPPSEFEAKDETVELSEDSETLKYLFSFMYPRRHPDIRTMHFDLFLKLAEAAEKYEVFAAMSICGIRIQDFIKDHPFQLFLFAYKHGYDELLALTAPLLLDKPLADMTETLPEDLVQPWIKFYEHWRQAVLRTFTQSLRPGETTRCEICVTTLSFAMYSFYSIPQSWGSTSSILDNIEPGFRGRTHFAFEVFKRQLEKNLGGIPPFDKFMRQK